MDKLVGAAIFCNALAYFQSDRRVGRLLLYAKIAFFNVSS